MIATSPRRKPAAASAMRKRQKSSPAPCGSRIGPGEAKIRCSSAGSATSPPKGGSAACSAGARVSVQVREEEGKLVFDVGDDGAGFDPANRAGGAGFTNMNDRLGAMGGALRVDAAPGKGTRISGAIPL